MCTRFGKVKNFPPSKPSLDLSFVKLLLWEALCVYSTVLLCCCHYGVIKHDDNEIISSRDARRLLSAEARSDTLRGQISH